MKRLAILPFCIFLFAGCASLTKTQVAAVNSFAVASEDFSAYPSRILSELADIRLHRRVFFANSVDSVPRHIAFLDSIYNYRVRDSVLIAKADITYKIIDKYAQSLLLLSANKYEVNLRKQSAHFGVSLDSLTTLYNSQFHAKLPTGIGAGVNQLIAFAGTQYIRSRQAREIKKFVLQADKLIEMMTSNLSDFLKAGIISELIDNESRNIRVDYVAFLNQAKTVFFNSAKEPVQYSNTRQTIASDLEYLQLRASIDYVSKLRAQTLKATDELRAAHAKLLNSIKEKRKLKTTIAEVQTFYQSVKEIRATLKKIDKYKAPISDDSND